MTVGEGHRIFVGVFVPPDKFEVNGAIEAADRGRSSTSIYACVVGLNCAIFTTAIAIYKISVITLHIEDSAIPTYLIAGFKNHVDCKAIAAFHEG